VDNVAEIRRGPLKRRDEVGREPSDGELGGELRIAGEKVVRLRSLGIRPASLNAPIGDDDSTEFGESVGDENAPTPFEWLRDENLRGEVEALIEVLDSREKKIISERFGLDGGKPKTLEDVGKDFGITRERIRQLQNIALAKLRRALSKREDLSSVLQPIAA